MMCLRNEKTSLCTLSTIFLILCLFPLIVQSKSPNTMSVSEIASAIGGMANENDFPRKQGEELFNAYIAKNGNVNSTVNGYGMTLLEVAAAKGYLGVAKKLIEKGANVDAGQWSPLYQACLKKHVKMAKLLLESGAAPNLGKGEPRGFFPINAAIYPYETPSEMSRDNVSKFRKDLAELLISHNADMNRQNAQGLTPYESAMNYGEKDIAKLIHENM